MLENLGKVAFIVMGEAEGQSYKEKVYVASVLWNRLYRKKELRFNPIEIDFHGWSRQIDKIDTKEERQAFIDSVNASYEAHENLAKYNDIFFFHTKIPKRKPSSFYETIKVENFETDKFAHDFFKIPLGKDGFYKVKRK